MIAQNSEVYNPPTYLFHYTRIWNKISVWGLYTSLFCAIIPTLFPYFCRSGIPTSCHIFKCFLLLVHYNRFTTGVIKFWGPRENGDPGSPFSLVKWGPLWENGDPLTIFVLQLCVVICISASMSAKAVVHTEHGWNVSVKTST